MKIDNDYKIAFNVGKYIVGSLLFITFMFFAFHFLSQKDTAMFITGCGMVILAIMFLVVFVLKSTRRVANKITEFGKDEK